MTPLKKILFIGPLNLGKPPQGGDSYKNRLILKFLENRFNVIAIDTSEWKKSTLVIPRVINSLFFLKYHRIILSANTMSSYYLIRLLNFNKKALRKSIYMVIGGDFGLLIRKGYGKGKFYQELKSIIVEGTLQKKELSNSSISDITNVVSNFKDFDKTWNFTKSQNYSKIRFVFLSRIHEEKGVLDIFEALELLSPAERDSFEIDFYGPIDSRFNKLFNEKVLAHNSICTYKGYLDILSEPYEAYKLLSEYDAFLFPTLNNAEGFAGVFIDAFISGLPVITTNWRMNSEIISQDKNGYIINHESPFELKETFLRIKQNPQELETIRTNNLNNAHKYHYENVLEKGLLPLIQ